MSKLNPQSRLTLAALMLALASNRLLNALAPDDLVWRLHDITLSASVLLGVLLAFLFVPYEFLRTKCLLAAALAMLAVDFACVIMQAGGYWYWLSFQIASGVASSAFYAARNHSKGLDEIDADHLYCLRTIPRSPQDFLISLMGRYGSDGAYSLYADGSIYRFKKGILVKRRMVSLPSNRYHAIKGARITPDLLVELDALQGKSWSLHQNCLTVFGPIWRRHSG